MKNRQRNTPPPSPKVKIVKIVKSREANTPPSPKVKIVKIVKSRKTNTAPSPKVKIVKFVVKQMSVNPTHPYQVKMVKIVKIAEIVKSRKANKPIPKSENSVLKQMSVIRIPKLRTIKDVRAQVYLMATADDIVVLTSSHPRL